jgi:hypothetical protein
VAKSTASEVGRRIEEIRPLVTECLSLREIRAWTLKHASWGASISEAQLKRYLARAKTLIKEASEIDRDYEIGAAKLRCERIIAKAGAKGDLHSQLAAVKQLCELFGLETPKRSELALSGAIDIGAAREALTKLLAREIAEGRCEDDEDAGD